MFSLHHIGTRLNCFGGFSPYSSTSLFAWLSATFCLNVLILYVSWELLCSHCGFLCVSCLLLGCWSGHRHVARASLDIMECCNVQLSLHCVQKACRTSIHVEEVLSTRKNTRMRLNLLERWLGGKCAERGFTHALSYA